ncbi:hypothetical protein B6658_003725 [Campylobacter coli]
MLLGDKQNPADLLAIQDEVQERYLVNFSLFQSIPDFWGLEQNFLSCHLIDLTKNQQEAQAYGI